MSYRLLYIGILAGFIMGCSSTSAPVETKKDTSLSLEEETHEYALCIKYKVEYDKEQGITDPDQLIDEGISACQYQGWIIAKILLERDGSVDPKYYDRNIQKYVLPDIEEAMKEEILSALAQGVPS